MSREASASRPNDGSLASRFILLLAFTLATAWLSSASQAFALPRCEETGLPEFRIGSPESYGQYRRENQARRKGCEKDWTLLVYMAADNDLSPYAFWDLYEMEAGYQSGTRAAGSTARTDLIVQLDTRGAEGVRRFHLHQSPEPFNGALDFEFFKKRTVADVRSPQIGETLTETGRPQTEAQKLKTFLNWGFREFPSKNTFVIVWGHGQGWTSKRVRQGQTLPPPAPNETTAEAEALAAGNFRPGQLDDEPFEGRAFGGLAFNETSGGFLGIPSLSSVLSQVSRDTLGGKPIDLYASDACLMQMAEVAAELRTSVRFISGSAQVQSFLGLPYRRLLYEINTGRYGGLRQKPQFDGTEDNAERVARMLPKLLEASFKPGGSQARFAPQAIRTVTMSSLATGSLELDLIPSLNDIGEALNAYVRETRTLERRIALDALAAHAPSFQGSAEDLGAFLTLLDAQLRDEAQAVAETPAARRLRAQAQKTREALQRTVLEWALGTDYRKSEDSFYLLGFRALSVWIPASEEDRKLRLPDFKKSHLYALAPAWAAWIGSLHGGRTP